MGNDTEHNRVVDEQRVAEALKRAALRRMVQSKNREKGSWRDVPLSELVRLARQELIEVERAIASGEGVVRIYEELGDVAAFVAMALDANSILADGEPIGCCCIGAGGDHRDHCPGYFQNEETYELERCDECGVFASDDDALEYVRETSARGSGPG